MVDNPYLYFHRFPIRRLFEERASPPFCPHVASATLKERATLFPALWMSFSLCLESLIFLNSVRFLFADPSFVKQIGVKSGTASAELLFEPNLEAPQRETDK